MSERMTCIDHIGWYVLGTDGQRLRGEHIDRLAKFENIEPNPGLLPAIKATYNTWDKIVECGGAQHIADLLKAERTGSLIESPFVAMIEQTLIDEKFSKKQKDQVFNGRYAVVYVDRGKWGCPLIDICGDTSYDLFEAEVRKAELRVLQQQKCREEGEHR